MFPGKSKKLRPLLDMIKVVLVFFNFQLFYLQIFPGKEIYCCLAAPIQLYEYDVVLVDTKSVIEVLHPMTRSS